MNTVKYDRKKLVRYLVWTFGIAYVMQGVVGYLYGIASDTQNPIYAQIARLVMTAMMFAPMAGVFLSGGKLKGMGFNPGIRKNVIILLISWFSPAIFTALGALVYFMIFPSHFDLSGQYIVANAGEKVLEQMQAQGITYEKYIIMSCITALTYVPIVNMLVSVGEEVGWRGLMYPMLKDRFGSIKGRIIGGAIWGIWHWPLIILIGYEYGSEYKGFPFSGLLVFEIFTIACGILCDYVYEKSECIWYPSIFHGVVNGVATITLAITTVDTGNMRLLGPAPNGLISVIPMVIVAVIILLTGRKVVKD